MDALLQYLDMGGYAAFVWSAYGLSAVGLVGIWVLTLRSLKAHQKEFDALKAARRGDSER